MYTIIDVKLEPDFNILYEKKLYELFQKGNAQIHTYYGYTDVALKDEVEYYEYKYNDDLLTIEKWKDETEISCGRYIDKNKIKIKKSNEDNYRL